MSLKAKIDVFPFESYILQDPSVASVIQAVVRGGGGGADGPASGGGSGGGGGGGEGAREAAQWRPKTPLEKLMSLKARCRDEPRVRSVEAVLLVHIHDHPHVLLLRHAAKGPEASFHLPGGRCRAGEAEEAALLRKLSRRLLGSARANTNTNANANANANAAEETADTVVDVAAPRAAVSAAASSGFRVGEALARWFRPHFEPFMYPYIPAHITDSDVSEVRTVFLVHMPPQMVFTMMHPNVQLVVAPLFDLYDNASKYGPIIASIPTHISRVNVNYCK